MINYNGAASRRDGSTSPSGGARNNIGGGFIEVAVLLSGIGALRVGRAAEHASQGQEKEEK